MLHADLEQTRIPAASGSSGTAHPLNRIRYQVLNGLLLTVMLPATLYHADDPSLAIHLPSSLNTAIGASVAFLIALYLYRRVATFPGVGLLGYVMPAVAAGYGIVLAVFFGMRLDYSRLNFGISFAAALAYF